MEKAMSFGTSNVIDDTIPKKINIGCGYDKRPGYLNVDMDAACEPDILVTDNDFSQFKRKSFQEVLAHDVLEHIPRAETANALLEWADLLAPGGNLTFQTSSIIGVANLIQEFPSYQDHANFTIYLFGNQQHPGDFHLTGFTDRTLRVHLHAALLEPSPFTMIDGWMYRGTAKKIGDWTNLSNVQNIDDEEFLDLACREALMRAPEQSFFDLWLSWLKAGSHSRRDILKLFYASDERRLRVAEQLNL
jgi:hypothetical protein